MNSEDVVGAGPSRQLELLAEGAITSRELTEATLTASRAVNAELNAFVVIDDTGALVVADDADRRRAAGDRAPMLGVPIAIKDDTDMAGRVTGWGSSAMVRPAEHDADIVDRIRVAGMVPIGKTNLPELAICGFTESETYGVSRNPHHHDHTPGGSSGGSAAAVAAGAVGIATGTDGAGSIRIPAACCGIVGFKPTQGTMPSSGGWHGLSTQGCLTRRVVDSALYLDAVGDFETPLVAAAGTDPEFLRIGVDLHPFPAAVPLALDPLVAEAVRETAELMRNLGHDVRDVKVSYGMAAQAMSVRYLAGIRDSARTTDEPARLERRTAQIAMLGKPLGVKAVSRAQAAGQRLGRDVMERLGIDILLTPTMSGPAVRVGRWAGKSGIATVLSMARFYAYTPAWNHTGQPAVSLPAGFTGTNLPLAVQFIAAPGDDARLMSLAGQVERSR